MKRLRFFGRDREPSCEYCKYGKISEFDGNLLCEKKGVFSEFSSCEKFSYDPLKRKPKIPKKNLSFSPEDFQL